MRYAYFRRKRIVISCHKSLRRNQHALQHFRRYSSKTRFVFPGAIQRVLQNQSSLGAFNRRLGVRFQVVFSHINEHNLLLLTPHIAVQNFKFAQAHRHRQDSQDHWLFAFLRFTPNRHRESHFQLPGIPTRINSRQIGRFDWPDLFPRLFWKVLAVAVKIISIRIRAHETIHQLPSSRIDQGITSNLNTLPVVDEPTIRRGIVDVSVYPNPFEQLMLGKFFPRKACIDAK